MAPVGDNTRDDRFKSLTSLDFYILIIGEET